MLKLERMEISGFKSFSDKTEVVFPPGITAVVGPNGCGKSNIGDALNWVLGEQSPRHLRGKLMADVIFNGSRARKPLGMAEVSLHLNGAEGISRAESGKIVVTRRLYRNGESDYLLNGARARLKDIQEVLREARIGTKTYATIEQGKVDQLLNARPKDRRLIIEDAAGIAGYKHKRRLTEMKLEATEANLLRVNDVIGEVRRQIGSLKRQAAKARRYQTLRDELRDKELLRFALRARVLDEALASAADAENAAKDREAAASAGLGLSEVEGLEGRKALEEANREYAEAAEALHRLDLEIAREERLVAECRQRQGEADEAVAQHASQADVLGERTREARERAERQAEQLAAGRAESDRLTQALSEHQARFDERDAAAAEEREAIDTLRRQQFRAVHEVAEQRNRRRSIEEALERNAQQRTRLEHERATASQERERLSTESSSLAREFQSQAESADALQASVLAFEESLRAARVRHAEQADALAASREREKSAAARLRTLEDVDTRFAGVSDGVKMLLGSGAAAGVRTSGVVADFVEAGADVEGVAERYLDVLLPTVILDDDDDVVRAADLLRERGAGRTSLIVRSHPAGGFAVGTRHSLLGEGSAGHDGATPVPGAVLADVRVQGRLSDRLAVKTAANGALQDRIGDALLVENLRAALELHRAYPGADYLTPDGEVVYASGVISVGGADDGDRGLLAHKRRIDETREELAASAAECEVQHQHFEASRSEVARLEAALPEERAALEAALRLRVELEHRTRRSSEDHERTERRSKVLETELENLALEADRLRKTLEEVAADVEKGDAAANAVEDEVERRGASLGEEQQRLKELGESVAALRADLAASQQRLESLEGERRTLDESIADLAARTEASAAGAQRERERASESRSLQARTEKSLAEHLGEQKSLQTRTREMERHIAERREALDRLEHDQRDARTALDKLRDETGAAALDRTRAEESRRHLDDLCHQELGTPAADARRAAGERIDGLVPDVLDEEATTLRVKLERLGPVNLTAIDEFADLEERNEFLTHQRDDLDRAMNSLRETIRRINRQSREKFVEAFDTIRANYQEIFKLLFSGGRADLRLEEDPDGGEIDVLECGVEIMAQPPGKRLASVQLLSGGEKAMSAIALLFAVFRYSPSPFCLLDEVDAALDDANVGRFARMVTEYAQNTQFILITHNKLSMEAADLMYGVTMQEPGVSRLLSLELQGA